MAVKWNFIELVKKKNTQTKKPADNPESPVNPSRIKKSTSRHSTAKFRTRSTERKRQRYTKRSQRAKRNYLPKKKKRE